MFLVINIVLVFPIVRECYAKIAIHVDITILNLGINILNLIFNILNLSISIV